MQHSPGFEALCEAARRSVTEVSVAEVNALMEGDNPPLLIDVREDNEWQKDRIAQSKHIGRGVLERDIEKAVADKAASIILYCGGGYRSALAAESLQKMGYSHVLSMAGGYRAWRESGYPITHV